MSPHFCFGMGWTGQWPAGEGMPHTGGDPLVMPRAPEPSPCLVSQSPPQQQGALADIPRAHASPWCRQYTDFPASSPRINAYPTNALSSLHFQIISHPTNSFPPHEFFPTKFSDLRYSFSQFRNVWPFICELRVAKWWWFESIKVNLKLFRQNPLSRHF